MATLTQTCELPFPPSVNHDWRRVGPRTRISHRGRRCRDALQHGGVYRDDSQIDRLEVERGPVARGGKAIVTITEGR